MRNTFGALRFATMRANLKPFTIDLYLTSHNANPPNFVLVHLSVSDIIGVWLLRSVNSVASHLRLGIKSKDSVLEVVQTVLGLQET